MNRSDFFEPGFLFLEREIGRVFQNLKKTGKVPQVWYTNKQGRHNKKRPQ